MMILAYLIQTSLPWRGAEVHLKMVVPSESAATQVRRNLVSIVEEIPMDAVPIVMVADGRPFGEILVQHRT